MSKNLDIAFSTDKKVVLYKNCKPCGLDYKCSNCDFGDFAIEWNDWVKEKVVMHLEKTNHRVNITLRYEILGDNTE